MLDAWGSTDPGNIRQNNEDSWCLEPSLHIAIVADGMGGASCGEVASALTVQEVMRCLRGVSMAINPAQEIEEAIRQANRLVIERAHDEETCAGMGSTVVVAYWELPQLIVCNVGDSRAYLWRDGAIAQLSYDQTLVNELRIRFGLSEQEVSNFPHKNVLTMAVGSNSELTIRTRTETLVPGDVVLLCSDGLTGPVSEAAIAATLSREAPLQYQVEQLITQAKANGGPDNITAVLLRYDDWEI